MGVELDVAVGRYYYNQRIVAFEFDAEGLGEHLLNGGGCGAIADHAVGVGEVPAEGFGRGWGFEVGHSTPFLELGFEWGELFGEVLGGLFVVAQKKKEDAFGAGIVGEGDLLGEVGCHVELGLVAVVAIDEGAEGYFFGDLVAGLDLEELHAGEDITFGIAIASGEAIIAWFELKLGGECCHARIVFEVEADELAVGEFLEGEVGVVDGFGGVLAAVGECDQCVGFDGCGFLEGDGLPIFAIPGVEGVGGVVEVGGDGEAAAGGDEEDVAGVGVAVAELEHADGRDGAVVVVACVVDGDVGEDPFFEVGG